MPKTILITGVSSGLGRAMAEAALARGHRVIGTLRQDAQRCAFERLAPGQAIGRLLDVTDTGAMAPLVTALEAEYGGIDVLVNNAGYGHRGAVEEIALDDLRRQFAVNVFAPIAMIQAVLPGMRARRRGHIINVASMGGVVTFPGLGAYHGSKFALLGLGDTLAQEVADLGIHVTSLLPGVYRSDWGTRSQSHARHAIADYDAVLNPAQKPELTWGDPAALGEVVMEAVAMADPPRHLLVGPTAVKLIRRRLLDQLAEIDRWEELSDANGEG